MEAEVLGDHVERARTRVDAALLQHDAHPARQLASFATRARRVEAENTHGSRGAPAKPLAHLDGAGLARTVGPEHRGDLSGPRRERDVVDGGEGPVADRQILDDECAFGPVDPAEHGGVDAGHGFDNIGHR